MTAALPVFLDHASTTPVDPRVAAAMAACLTGPEGLGNPSSATHLYGRAAAARIERARAEVATLVGAAPSDIVFTSGATESDNLALLGIARGRASFGRHPVVPHPEGGESHLQARRLPQHAPDLVVDERLGEGGVVAQEVEDPHLRGSTPQMSRTVALRGAHVGLRAA